MLPPHYQRGTLNSRPTASSGGDEKALLRAIVHYATCEPSEPEQGLAVTRVGGTWGITTADGSGWTFSAEGSGVRQTAGWTSGIAWNEWAGRTGVMRVLIGEIRGFVWDRRLCERFPRWDHVPPDSREPTDADCLTAVDRDGRPLITFADTRVFGVRGLGSPGDHGERGRFSPCTQPGPVRRRTPSAEVPPGRYQVRRLRTDCGGWRVPPSEIGLVLRGTELTFHLPEFDSSYRYDFDGRDVPPLPAGLGGLSRRLIGVLRQLAGFTLLRGDLVAPSRGDGIVRGRVRGDCYILENVLELIPEGRQDCGAPDEVTPPLRPAR